MSKGLKSLIRFSLNIAISILILFVLFTKIPFGEVFTIVKGLNIPIFVLAIFLGFFSIFMNALRWQILLNYLGYNYKPEMIIRLSFITLFFNYYLPGGVAGEVVRVAMLPKPDNIEDKQRHISQIAASVVTDRLSGLIGLMFLALLGFIFCFRFLRDLRVLPVFILMAVGISFVSCVLFSRRAQNLLKRVLAFPLKALSPLKKVIKKVTDSLFVYRDNYSVFKSVIPISILGQLMMVGYFFLIVRALNVDLGFLKLLAFAPVIEFISALPISIGGAGIREVATIFMFSSEGIPATLAMSVSLLSLVLVLILGGAGGILLFFNKIKQL